MTSAAMHAAFDDVLDNLVRRSGVSRNVLASVLVRVMVVAPDDAVRADIARGSMLGRPRALNPAAVSKAVAALLAEGFLSEGPLQSDKNRRAGRPVKPLRMGTDQWGLMGIKVIHADARPTALTGVVMNLRTDVLVEWSEDLPDGVTFETVADHIEALVLKLKAMVADIDKAGKTATRQILALGVDVASHVHRGHLIGATHMGLPVNEDFDLMTPLQERLGLPVVIDNDVNLLAVRELYRSVYAERDIALIAVFNDGVGGALILDGHLYRGGGGMAAEPGHQRVHVDLANAPGALHPAPDERRVGFSAPCHCEKPGHIDCYAVPARLLAEVPEATTFSQAAGLPAYDSSGQLTRAGWAFRVGGDALGQGIAMVINNLNPKRLVLIVPAELSPADAGNRSAAAEYLSSVEHAVSEYSFSSGAKDARADATGLTVDVLNADDVRRVGAVSAAIRAFDTFIQHARGRDDCQSQDALGDVRSIA